MKRIAPLLALTLVAGCAYFNGIYNARQAEKRGDRESDRGRDAAAAGFYGIAAAKAETVLVRHSKSGWSDDALYLAGRGWALSSQCDRAVPRLEAFLALPSRHDERSERAALALGICRVKLSQHVPARELLVPLLRSRNSKITNLAAVWAARASMALGENDSALVYLRGASASAAEWELATAYLSQRRFTAAESLLVRRAEQGDYRPDILGVMSELWAAGRKDAVLRLAATYASSRARRVEKARIHLAAGDLLMAQGQDSVATTHFIESQRLGRDSIPAREATARLTLLSLGTLATLPDIEAAIVRSHEAADGTALQRRLEQNLLFVKILDARTDYTGSSLFLAGEVARDSLGGGGYAHAVFKRIAATIPNAPVAPKALLAAAALRPDSAQTYNARLREQYASSPYVLELEGRDNPILGAVKPAETLLQQAWTAALKEYTDSLTVRQRAASATTNAQPAPVPPPPA
ncbi:MAG: hypothetical protein H7Z74_12240 [Anaerolineae bacterium]|nr:hypothetical protein [Gemmatimonadaceae bacterium]